MTAYEIIDKKAQGYELTPEEAANVHAGFSPLAFIPLVAAVAIAIGGVLIVLKKKTK